MTHRQTEELTDRQRDGLTYCIGLSLQLHHNVFQSLISVSQIRLISHHSRVLLLQVNTTLIYNDTHTLDSAVGPKNTQNIHYCQQSLRV